MPMDEVIRGIERADAEDIQDIMRSAMDRYRELYPQWKMMFLSANPNAKDARNQVILDFINQAESMISGL